MKRHRLEDLNRRDLNFNKSQVKDILPEYFLEDYPKLVDILESYYEFMDSDGDQSFKTEINNIITARDINQTSEENLDQLIATIGNGLQSSSFFHEPRLMAKLLANFYRVKGTLLSAETFFRAFFNEEAEIFYPKDDMFIVNESKIGYEFRKFIQDNRRYQVFSTLIKVGLSVSEYEELYKKFVHPAGFYLEGEVLLEADGIITPSAFTGVDSDEIRNIRNINPVLISIASLDTQAPFALLTSLRDSTDGTPIRINASEFISLYETYTLEYLRSQYTSIDEMIGPNSFTFDDSATSQTDSTGTYMQGPTIDNVIETMDNEIFTRYLSDSSI
jgi:hypothetical protein